MIKIDFAWKGSVAGPMWIFFDPEEQRMRYSINTLKVFNIYF